ncbi:MULTISPECIES: telomere-protecting terminal protein Tpg [Streptomyces]|uniref:telomere-protecting terminal protein Tpg n=1 Tax=Streptomyces TaxID=1883 RepID=UPI0002E77502
MGTSVGTSTVRSHRPSLSPVLPLLRPTAHARRSASADPTTAQPAGGTPCPAPLPASGCSPAETDARSPGRPAGPPQARQKAATTGGIVIDTRARTGYTALIGTTDEDRLRHLTVALPPRYAVRLFDDQEQEAAVSSSSGSPPKHPKEMYFQDNGRRAGQLEEVRFTDIEHLEFDL